MENRIPTKEELKKQYGDDIFEVIDKISEEIEKDYVDYYSDVMLYVHMKLIKKYFKDFNMKEIEDRFREIKQNIVDELNTKIINNEERRIEDYKSLLLDNNSLHNLSEDFRRYLKEKYGITPDDLDIEIFNKIFKIED